MRKLKTLLISLASIALAFLCLFSLPVKASGEITAVLEQQEQQTDDTVTAIRYVCTLSNVTDLNAVNEVELSISLYKYGSGLQTKTVSTTKVYSSVTDSYTAKANTYYAVFTVTNANNWNDYTISAMVTLKMSDSTKKYSNEISYTINDSGDTFIKSMDASAVPALESVGVKYYNVDSETPEDVYKILADNGVNYIRVRIWNDPKDTSGNYYGGGNCDLANAIAISKRANKYGLKMLVDFQYSDFWADPGKQILPKAWAGYSTSQIQTAVYNWTKDCLTEMKENGIDVGMVQVGNETNDSMCGVMGEEGTMSTICSFMSKGSAAVREVYPNALVALHFANPSNTGNYTWYASELNSAGVDYDVFGTSYYPYWHGTQANLTSILTSIATTYNKKVMILETSYANCEMENDSANSDGYGNTVYTKATTISENGDLADVSQPYTVAGQKQQVEDMIDLIAAIKDSNNQYGIGVSYWEGTWISTAKYATALGITKEELWNTYGTGWAATYASSYYEAFASSYSDWLSTSGQKASDYTISSAGGCVIENEAFFDEDGHAFESIAAFKHTVSCTKDVTADLYVPATTDVTSSTLTNEGFESWSTSGWTTTGTSIWDVQAPNTGSGVTGSAALHFYSSSASGVDFSFKQDISGVSGSYTFTMDCYGASTVDIKLFVIINGEWTSLQGTINETWGTWSTPCTLNFTCTSTDTVVVGVYVYDTTAGSWGWLDNAKLVKRG